VNRVVLIICFLVYSMPWAFADDPAMAQKSAVVEHTIFAGLVKSVSWADPVKGTKSEIVVTDAAKKNIHILVTATTTLWDADAKPILPDKITVKCHVNIIYLTTVEGVNIGKIIKIVK
jgi:hypothetical protein